jgi:hypothetical protein
MKALPPVIRRSSGCTFMRCTAPGRPIQQAHGGFYRHFDSREHLVAEAAQRALSQGQRMDDRGRQSRRAARIHRAH